MTVSEEIDNQLRVGNNLEKQYPSFYLMFPEIGFFFYMSKIRTDECVN